MLQSFHMSCLSQKEGVRSVKKTRVRYIHILIIYNIILWKNRLNSSLQHFMSESFSFLFSCSSLYKYNPSWNIIIEYHGSCFKEIITMTCWSQRLHFSNLSLSPVFEMKQQNECKVLLRKCWRTYRISSLVYPRYEVKNQCRINT
jgi:hypothetical protein